MERSYSSPSKLRRVESSKSELKRREKEKKQKDDQMRKLAAAAEKYMESNDLDAAEEAIVQAEELGAPAPEIMSSERMEQIKHSSAEVMDKIEAEKELHKDMIFIHHPKKNLDEMMWVPKPGSDVEYLASKQFPELKEIDLVIPAKIESVKDGHITLKCLYMNGEVATRIVDVEPRLIKKRNTGLQRDLGREQDLYDNLIKFLRIMKGGGRKKSKRKSKRKKSKEKSKRKKSKEKSKRKKLKGKSKRKKSKRKSKKR